MGRFVSKARISVVILVLMLPVACSAPSTPEPTKTALPIPSTVPSTESPTQTVAASPEALPTLASSTQLATATKQPTVQATPMPKAVPTALPTASRTLLATRQPTSTSSPVVLLPPPQLIQPGTRASYSYRSPVILTWTWELSLGQEEYYEVQLSRDDSPLADLGCTTGNTFQINPPPALGYGWYQWRVLVRRGQGQGCTPLNDLSQPSEIRTFEWRTPPPETRPPYP